MKTKASDRHAHGRPTRGRAGQTGLRVSFEYLDWETKEFFLHGFDAEFYVRLFTCLETIQTCTQEQLEKQNHPSLNCKAIFKSSTGSHDGFPRHVIDKIATTLRHEGGAADPMVEAVRIARLAFEVSMGKSQGVNECPYGAP